MHLTGLKILYHNSRIKSLSQTSKYHSQNGLFLCLFSMYTQSYIEGHDFKYILVGFFFSPREKRRTHQEPIPRLGQGYISNQQKGRTVESFQIVSNATKKAPNFDPFFFPILRKEIMPLPFCSQPHHPHNRAPHNLHAGTESSVFSFHHFQVHRALPSGECTCDWMRNYIHARTQLPEMHS